ncbi:MAG TPA: radical SAM protein [Candidatus Acidoferrum sp.]|nr:radical SAM protein [Candidatus Methylomirabilis sp.]HWU37092.1 radical SAM protein [Candidatus Acidoferrum sp.]
MAHSLGLGLTNECNLTCAHCYRPTGGVYRLSLEDVRRTCDSLPIGSANLGTGENGLHPEFIAIVEHLVGQNILTSLTTNGYTVQVMPDPLLKSLREVEFSFDFPTPQEQDSFRGPGSWDMAMRAMERCRGLGLTVTIIAVMMRTNYRRLPEVARLAQRHGANFRVNVYQPVKSDAFSMSYEEFWDGWRRLFDTAGVVSTTEPIVNVMLGLNSLAGCACGRRTIRVTPKRRVIPCVYWTGDGLPLERLWTLKEAIFHTDEFCAARHVPDACRGCAFEAICAGGCVGRRLLAGDIKAPDPYCPIIRQETLQLSARMVGGKALLKSGSACTTILTMSDHRGAAP